MYLSVFVGSEAGVYVGLANFIGGVLGSNCGCESGSTFVWCELIEGIKGKAFEIVIPGRGVGFFM